jgi:hypothetical protein
VLESGAELNFDDSAGYWHDQVDSPVSEAWMSAPIVDDRLWKPSEQSPKSFVLITYVIDDYPTARDVLHLGQTDPLALKLRDDGLGRLARPASNRQPKILA